MAMTVRLPEELDAQLEAVARARHTSKHALLIEAASRYLAQEAKTDLVMNAVAEIELEYADALERLERT